MGKKIKIAHVITRMDWGGSPDIVRMICQAGKDSYEMKLITGPGRYLTSETKRFLEEFKDSVIEVPSLCRDIKPLRDIAALVKLYHLFRKEKFDIIHTHTAKAGFLGRIAGRLAGGAKIIYMSHGHVFYGYFGPMMSILIKAAEIFAGWFTDVIIALTELEKKDFLSLNIKETSSIRVVPSGLEFDRFDERTDTRKEEIKKELGLDPSKKIVGLVSRLEHVKGPEYFVEAAKKIHDTFQEVEFVVAGEGILRDAMARRAGELGLDGKISFLGWCENIPDIISVLDVMVQPSLNEAVGRALLEAQALGVPVVATDVGGIQEVVKDGSTGIIVPSRDADALAEGVLSLLENAKKRQKFAAEARKWIRSRFSSEKMVEKIFEIYNDLVRP